MKVPVIWSAHDRILLYSSHPDAIVQGFISRVLAGVLGTSVARELAVAALVKRVRADGRYCLMFDDEPMKVVAIEVPVGGPLNVMSLVHEFGHAYHCFQWPELSAVAWHDSRQRAEAAAQLFMYTAEKRGLVDGTVVHDYDVDVNSRVRALAQLALPFQPLSKGVRLLLEGWGEPGGHDTEA